MPRPIGRHDDQDGFGGHRTYRVMRGFLPALLVFLLVPVISVLKVSTGTTGTTPCDCQTCHVDPHAGGFTGCTSCHGAPPATGSHQVHFDNSAPVDGLRYGDATNRSAADAYIFDCGNCHPLDSANHMNGTVNVELYNASAPAETLKAKNPASAAYDTVGKTCGNVYCHSGYTVTSGAVGLPLTYPENPVPPGYVLNRPQRDGIAYIMDPTCSNLTYAPYTVTKARVYATTPVWGTTGTFATCTECHAFPLTTYYPAVSAMAGDTHQWVDENGWNWGHAYNMLGVGGIPCATCHYGSVDHSGGGSYPHAQTTNPPTYWAGNIIAYNPAPIKDRSVHLNGRSDVAFDNVNGYRYYYINPPYYNYDDQFDLTAATYDAPTQTCSNVSCHYNSPVVSTLQPSPKWGSPYGPYSVSGASIQCDLCHRMGYLSPTCEPVP